MFTRLATLMFVSLLAAPGCVEDLGPEDLTGGVSSDGGESDAEGSEAELEEKVDEDAPAPEALLACDLEMACEHPLELVRSDPAAAYAASDECALKSLAGGSLALVQTVAVFPDAQAYLDHVVLADGSVLRQGHGFSDDLGIWQRPVERCTLVDAAFFAGCLEQFDAACLDPDRWVVAGSCEALGSLTCPRP